MADTNTVAQAPSLDDRKKAAMDRFKINNDEGYEFFVKRLEIAAEKFETATNEADKDHYLDQAIACMALLR